ncbi:glycoside hydrolase family 71 protein [Aspergillus stella-maris]|uniref:glycoside hydrolase family 71 protein n=1 Tax=Aspergillus stella-maris TaxID=1810926 RepID=UPI003CCE3991
MKTIFHRCFAALSVLLNALPVLSLPHGQDETQLVTRQSANKYVTAHFMVGIVENYTLEDWKTDMELAKETGIDAFALNCASIDSYTDTQLALAYEAAEEVSFKVFISFDFAYWSNGDTARITSIMQTYASHPGQFQYDDLGALVSTFVGDSFNWGPVKNANEHKIFAVPNLQDPNWAANANTDIDGAFSWYAWPTDGGNSIIPGPMTTIWDDRYISNTERSGKVYMAPVSPWFSTHFNTKNWVFICEDQPHLRWKQMLEMKPQLIEIISWNDYGESHYIGPYSSAHSDDGSAQWTKDFPHDAWRIIAKPYIAAYKAGLETPTVERDELVYWYRPTPKGVTCSKDPLGPPNGRDMLSDSIFVTTLLTEPATLSVVSGSQQAVEVEVDAGIVTTNFTMGVGEQRFSLTRGGEEILGGQGGLDVVDACDFYNFNVYVGSFA